MLDITEQALKMDQSKIPNKSKSGTINKEIKSSSKKELLTRRSKSSSKKQ